MTMKVSVLILLAIAHAVKGQNQTCPAPQEGSCQRCEVPVNPGDVPDCEMPLVGGVSLCYQEDAVIICSASPEKILCYSVSRCCLHTKFPGRFHTKDIYSRIHNNLTYDQFPPTTPTQQCPPNTTSDNDRCCETCRYFSEAPTTVSVDDRPCYVVHAAGSDEYQYVPGAVCGETGACPQGGCFPEATENQLVCVQWSGSDSGLRYRIGYEPSTAYCSCKNTFGGRTSGAYGKQKPYILLIAVGILCLVMLSL